MKPTEYAEALWNKARRYDLIYVEYDLRGILIEGTLGSIWHSMCSYCSSRENTTTFHELMRHVRLLTSLQHGLQSIEDPYITGKP